MENERNINIEKNSIDYLLFSMVLILLFLSNTTIIAAESSILYSLQLNTYNYESAAQRAYEDLPETLQSRGFVYITDSGYYTLRIGQAESKDDLLALETELDYEGYDFKVVKTDPKKLPPEIAIDQPTAQVKTSPKETTKLLHSLQLNTYNYESAAQRAYESLPDSLKSEGFVYLTENGYYTVRLGRTESRESLQSLEAKLADEGYGYSAVKTNPAKLTSEEKIVVTEKLQDVAEPVKEDKFKPSEENRLGATEKLPAPEITSATRIEEVDTPTASNFLQLSLQEAIDLALEGNKKIKIASFYPSIATEELEATQSIYDSSLFAENNITRTDRPIQSELDNGNILNENFMEHQWDARAGVKKPIPTGGVISLYADVDHLNSSSELVVPNPQYASRLTAQVRQALLREFGDKSNKTAINKASQDLEISNAEYQRTLSNVLREVGSTYWNFTYFHNQYMINKDALESSQEIFKREKSRNEQGLSNNIDVDRAFSEVQDRQRELITAKTQYMVAMDQLKLLLGIMPGSKYFDADLLPTDTFPTQPSTPDSTNITKTALNARPEILITNKQIEIASMQKELEKHKKLPKLDATASYSFNSLDNGFNDAFGDTYFSDDGSWAIGLEFEWPFGGRKASAKYAKAMYKHLQAEADYNRAVEQVIYEVHTALNEVTQAIKEIEAARKARDANKRVLEMEITRYKLARISNQGLLDAQDDYYDAERKHLKANLNFNIALLKLKWAKGSLHQEFGINSNM